MVLCFNLSKDIQGIQNRGWVKTTLRGANAANLSNIGAAAATVYKRVLLNHLL
jgi:hypothetical protein